MPVSFPPSTSLRLKTSSSASPFPRYFWYDLHGATSGFLIVRPALCVVPLQNLCRVASWTRVAPFHALLATWLNRQLPWWVSHPQERRPSWHTIPLVRLVPRILDDLEPVGIDDETLGASGFNLIRPEKRSRPGLHDHRVFWTKCFYIGVEISDRMNELFFNAFPIQLRDCR